ncbi:SIR2 family NAD-dependent protein deacylase [Ferruginibacter albus]|uniref:SIR2 family NAD-dependent protein deacylase n=1 Tax=Ferruginibacter albus TaxID=2875540 RepID=UPI001CC44C54|nr:NAD-dependent deacylase [Ferruginibacter albus]UAY50901.1 NAD-dependent deacylase [Ferruginibacter albus]
MPKKQIVILTGAGISAESGLQTFRDADGLWMGYDVYEVASPRGWKKDPQLVLDFYNMRRKDVAAAKPNAAHLGLAALEKDFDITIVTQNIDDLHERAGSTNVLHLHGEIFKMRSIVDEETIYEIRGDINIGDMAKDGHQLRSHIVWFEEPVPMIEKAVKLMRNCDVFVVIGTSLQVYPAASLLHYAPSYLPKYIIDKKIPSVESSPNLHFIEKPATEGVKKLQELLSKL